MSALIFGSAEAQAILKQKKEYRPRRYRITATVECPRCHKQVKCVAETDEWEWQRGRWVSSGFGPGTGECCGLLFVDGLYAMDCYDLERRT